MNKLKCTNLQKPSSFWRSLRLFFSALLVLPLALIIILIKQILRFMTLRIRRPMVKKPIRLEAMETEDFEEEEKKTQEWLKNFDDPSILSNARYIAEYNYHLPNKKNNEQNNLTKYPDVDYDDSIN